MKSKFWLWCLMIILTFALSYAPTVLAKSDTEPCALLGNVNGADIYRCEDPDFGIVCYSQGMMLFCLEY